MTRLPFRILYEDRDLIVIDKPAGLLTIHTHRYGRTARESQMTAENLLNGYIRKGQLKSRKRVWLVHRLDRGTSGVMMFVKSEELSEAVRSEWNRLTVKRYLARVDGELEAEEGFFESYLCDNPRTMKVSSVSDPKLGKLARTEWRMLSKSAGTTLVEVTLKSGRKNQIRVHFSEAGHPVVGDLKYGGRKAGRLCLHAKELVFRHPFSGREFRWQSPCVF